MQKVIIGIHGLGNKPSKQLLSKWWKDEDDQYFLDGPYERVIFLKMSLPPLNMLGNYLNN